MIMRGSRKFCLGGGGGVASGPSGIKKLWQCFFFIFFLFFSPQLILQNSSGTFKENYHFPRFHWGWTIFLGSNFFRMGGSNCLFPIETHITCDFPGSRPPASPTPLDPPMWFRASWFNLYTRFSLFFFNITFANSFCRKTTERSISTSAASSSSYKIYTLSGVMR